MSQILQLCPECQVALPCCVVIMDLMTKYIDNNLDMKLCKGLLEQGIVCQKNYMYKWMCQGQRSKTGQLFISIV